MSEIKKICEEVIAAGEKSSARPWNVCGPLKTAFSSDFFCVVNKEEQICQTAGDMTMRIPEILNEQQRNADYIVTAANSAELLAKAFLIQQEAIEKAMYLLAGDYYENWETAHEELGNALFQVNALMGEK